jgi:class 3 adenylate cyclase
MSVRRPRTRFADSKGVHIAYQVTGEDNPVDFVFAPGSISHLDMDWDWPEDVAWIERVSRYTRLIRFDKRGTGLSDRVTEAATLEERTDDIRAVMDAAGSGEAVIAGYSEGGSMATLFATTYPQRTRGLILTGTQARWWRSDDFPYPVWSQAEYARIVEELEREGVTDEWLFGPGFGLPRDDPAILELAYRYVNAAASPSALAALERMNMQIDTRAIVGLVQVPTLVINASIDPVSPLAGAQWLADHIPDARLLTVDSGHSGMPDDESVQAEIEEFVTGVRPAPRTDRMLATVLFTDIVGSTEKAAQLGDLRWSALLDQHHQRTREEFARFGGIEVDTTGDGFLATFDGPERAVRCASAIHAALQPIGIEIRAGLHAGELVRTGTDVSGIAVHLAARIMALSQPGQVLVSRTVRDLVVGSTLRFSDAGNYRLKGFDDEWQVYELI